MNQDRGHRDTRPDRTDAAELEPRVRRPDETPAGDATSAQDATSARKTTSAQDATSARDTASPDTAPETAEHPAPGITHRPEPDAENIIPVKDEPGTL